MPTILPEKRAVEKTLGGKVLKTDYAGLRLFPSPDDDYMI
jgi:hypothetical protein